MKKLYLFLICALCALNAFGQLTGADEIKNVIIHERPLDDAHKMRNGTNFRDYGPTITSGTAKFFGIRMSYNGSDYRYANLRFALYNMQKEIVELYKPMRVYLWPDGINGFVIPCQVNAPAGDYYVVPMFRWDEDPENEWTVFDYSIFHPDNDIDGYYQSLWKFTVIEDKLPLVKQMVLPDGLLYTDQGQKFDMKVKLSNPYNVAKKGKLKIMHERNMKKFCPGYNYSSEAESQEFLDCMTLFSNWNGAKPNDKGEYEVTIQPSSDLVINLKNLVCYEDRGVYDQFPGEMYCSFLPDGLPDVPENWIMLQEDCRGLFNGSDLIYTSFDDDYNYAVGTVFSEFRNYAVIVLVPNPAGVPEIALSEVSISYDRTTGLLHFANTPEPCRVSVVAMNGSTIMSETVSGDSSINVKETPAGMYVLTFSNNMGELIKSVKVMIR